MLVSIIIPNYNHVRYLRQRIESVLAQTYQNFEVIIMDDCSPDSSREIIEEYRHHEKVARIVYNEHNSGSTFKQWNKGIKLAQGEAIWIAESDDYANPRLLERLVQQLQADAGVGLAYCNSLNVNENGNILDDNTKFYADLHVDLWQHDFVKPGQELILRYMAYRNIIPNASAVLFRRSAAEQAGPADETKRILGDWLFWMAVIAPGKVAYVAEHLNFFRHHTQNVRSSTAKNGIALRELLDVLGQVRQYGTPRPEVFAKSVDFLYYLWFDEPTIDSISLKTHLQIYKSLSKLGVGVNSKVFWYLFHNKRQVVKKVLSWGK